MPCSKTGHFFYLLSDRNNNCSDNIARQSVITIDEMQRHWSLFIKVRITDGRFNKAKAGQYL